MKSAGTFKAQNEKLARRNRIMKRRARRGWKSTELARRYGMTQANAWRIINNPNSGEAR